MSSDILKYRQIFHDATGIWLLGKDLENLYEQSKPSIETFENKLDNLRTKRDDLINEIHKSYDDEIIILRDNLKYELSANYRKYMWLRLYNV